MPQLQLTSLPTATGMCRASGEACPPSPIALSPDTESDNFKAQDIGQALLLASRVPGFCVLLACRYLFVDSVLAAVQASPTSKVATLSQESLALLLSVRTELDAAQRQAPAVHEVGPYLCTFAYCLEKAMLSLCAS